MADLLPVDLDLEAYRALYARDEVWTPALERIRIRHALPSPLLRAPLGSHLVWYAGATHVIKLFAPLFPSDHEAETALLPLVHGRLGVRTPRILADGDLDGWSYLVLDRVPGRPATEVWAEVPRAERLRLLGEAGEVLARVHELPVEEPAAQARAWTAFVRDRLTSAPERDDLSPALRRDVGRFLADLALLPGPDFRAAHLYADLTGDHLLLHPVSRGRWHLASLIDFGDARVGDRRYDLVAPGLDLALGDGEAQAALVRGAGLENDPGVSSHGLLGWSLIHAYVDLREVVPGGGDPVEAPSLAALARRLWPPETPPAQPR